MDHADVYNYNYSVPTVPQCAGGGGDGVGGGGVGGSVRVKVRTCHSWRILFLLSMLQNLPNHKQKSILADRLNRFI